MKYFCSVPIVDVEKANIDWIKLVVLTLRKETNIESYSVDTRTKFRARAMFARRHGYQTSSPILCQCSHLFMLPLIKTSCLFGTKEYEICLNLTIKIPE